MHVHLVSVKVGVVGRGHTEVETERGPGKDFDPVTHHGHFVEGRLTVEDDQVIIDNVTLHLCVCVCVCIRVLCVCECCVCAERLVIAERNAEYAFNIHNIKRRLHTQIAQLV